MQVPNQKQDESSAPEERNKANLPEKTKQHHIARAINQVLSLSTSYLFTHELSFILMFFSLEHEKTISLSVLTNDLDSKLRLITFQRHA